MTGHLTQMGEQKCIQKFCHEFPCKLIIHMIVDNVKSVSEKSP